MFVVVVAVVCEADTEGHPTEEDSDELLTEKNGTERNGMERNGTERTFVDSCVRSFITPHIFIIVPEQVFLSTLLEPGCCVLAQWLAPAAQANSVLGNGLHRLELELGLELKYGLIFDDFWSHRAHDKYTTF